METLNFLVYKEHGSNFIAGSREANIVAEAEDFPTLIKNIEQAIALSFKRAVPFRFVG
jgi:hypothetical protein